MHSICLFWIEALLRSLHFQRFFLPGIKKWIFFLHWMEFIFLCSIFFSHVTLSLIFLFLFFWYICISSFSLFLLKNENVCYCAKQNQVEKISDVVYTGKYCRSNFYMFQQLLFLKNCRLKIRANFMDTTFPNML